MRSDKIRDISMMMFRMTLPLRRRAIRSRLKTGPPASRSIVTDGMRTRRAVDLRSEKKGAVRQVGQG